MWSVDIGPRQAAGRKERQEVGQETEQGSRIRSLHKTVGERYLIYFEESKWCGSGVCFVYGQGNDPPLADMIAPGGVMVRRRRSRGMSVGGNAY